MHLKYLIHLFFLVLLTGCKGGFFDPVVEVELPEYTNNLAITAHLSNVDANSLVYLTTTNGILEQEEILSLADAKVILFEENQLIQQYDYERIRIDTAEDGTLIPRTIFRGEKINFKTGQSYKLQVEKLPFEIIETIQNFPVSVPIIGGFFKKGAIADIHGDVVDEISLKFKDIPNEENYYIINVRLLTRNENSNMIKVYPTISTTNPIAKEIKEGLMFSDVTFDGQEYELRIAVSDLETQLGDAIEIKLVSISKDRFLFEEALNIYKDNINNPFAEPIILHENVVGGNGIFTLGNSDQLVIPIE